VLDADRLGVDLPVAGVPGDLGPACASALVGSAVLPAPTTGPAPYRDIIHDLLAARDSLNRHETWPDKLATARIVFALTPQAHSMAKAAVYLWDGGYLTGFMPVVRTCFESEVARISAHLGKDRDQRRDTA
jgi:hypothetical protein